MVSRRGRLMRLPAQLAYLKQAFALCEEAVWAHNAMRILDQPRESELVLWRRVYDEIDRRNDYRAIVLWLDGTYAPGTRAPDGRHVYLLVKLLGGLVNRGILPRRPNARVLLEWTQPVPPYCECRVPPEFRQFGHWLERLSPLLTEGSIVDMIGKLSDSEQLDLRALAAELHGGDVFEKIEKWMRSVDWERCPEAARMHNLMLLLDHIGLL